MTLTPEQRAVWLKDRQTGITGTDIASIVLPSDWGCPGDVWYSKLNDVEGEDNEYKRWGRLQEPIIANVFAENHGVELIEPQTVMRHPDIPYVIGTPDRLIKDTNELLEIKTASARSSQFWGEQGTAEIPERYFIQIQWYLGLTGRDIGHVAVKLDSYDYREYKVHANQKLISELFRIAGDFWKKYVETKTPPTPSAESAISPKYLKEARDDGSMLTFTADGLALASRYAEADEKLKEAETNKKGLRAQIENLIGEASGIEGEGFKFTWKANKDSRVTDWESLARFLAEAYHLSEIDLNEHIAKFTSVKKGARVFRFSQKKS